MLSSLSSSWPNPRLPTSSTTSPAAATATSTGVTSTRHQSIVVIVDLLRALRKAAENADDDGILEGIHESLTGEVKAGREKLVKAKELIKASRQETKDLNEEFEREREMMLDDMRKQNQRLKFQLAVIDRIVPRARQDWLMSRVSTSGASGSSTPHGARPTPSYEAATTPRMSGAAKA
eukprot:gene2190-5404_t